MPIDISSIPLHNLPEFSVSEISSLLKKTVEDSFGYVRVRGEVSGLKRATSGHLYFRLKDESALMDAVCWRGLASKFGFELEDGVEIVVSGKITTFAGKSSYQIIAEKIELAGRGALMVLFEKLKEKLLKEGLFEAKHKKQLPKFPSRIGVITSPTGAVIQDIIHRISERFPLHILLYPVQVQGDGAKEQIADAINKFNLIKDKNYIPDVIILARGGGSIEDLWAFNEELVVRAVFASKIPIISAVGHETDTTLCDFVADLRAPTPTAAAELSTGVRSEMLNSLYEVGFRLKRITSQKISEQKNLLQAIFNGLKSPLNQIESLTQRLDYGLDRLKFSFNSLLARFNLHLQKKAEKLLKPKQIIEKNISKVAILSTQLNASAKKNLNFKQLDEKIKFLDNRLLAVYQNRLNLNIKRLENIDNLLNSLSYKKVLERGYSVVRGVDGSIINTAKKAITHQQLGIEFSDGKIKVRHE